ncbi:MAG: RcnB family protein, partial [Ottowia sp.]|nr:RcnB family protein [Ottowia sp.]
WQRGHWVPPHARRPVHNWRAHRLPPPAWGHQWVQLDGSFAQIALSTGLITLIVNA